MLRDLPVDPFDEADRKLTARRILANCCLRLDVERAVLSDQLVVHRTDHAIVGAATAADFDRQAPLATLEGGFVVGRPEAEFIDRLERGEVRGRCGRRCACAAGVVGKAIAAASMQIRNFNLLPIISKYSRVQWRAVCAIAAA